MTKVYKLARGTARKRSASMPRTQAQRSEHTRAALRLPDLIAYPTFHDALNKILDEVVRGKGWGREVTGRALLEMGTSAERLPIEAPHKLIQPLIELGQARGEIRRDLPSDALAHFVLRSILGALRDWGLGADILDRETALSYALTLVFDAISVR